MNSANGNRTSAAELAAHEAAVRQGVREAVLRDARLGYPIVGMRDGKIAWMTAEEVIAAFAIETTSDTRLP